MICLGNVGNWVKLAGVHLSRRGRFDSFILMVPAPDGIFTSEECAAGPPFRVFLLSFFLRLPDILAGLGFFGDNQVYICVLEDLKVI